MWHRVIWKSVSVNVWNDKMTSTRVLSCLYTTDTEPDDTLIVLSEMSSLSLPKLCNCFLIHLLCLFLCLQTTTRVLNVLAEVSSWNNLPNEDLVHLDCRSRWIPPDEEGVYPMRFQCPFRGCQETFSAAQECSTHVSAVKHPKTNQGEGKNWLCAGTFTGKMRFQGTKKVRFIACHSGKL